MTLDTLKSANRVIGIKQVTKAVKRNAVAMVFIARDADERVTAELKAVCQEYSVLTDETVGMQEIGKACNIEVGAAAAAILK